VKFGEIRNLKADIKNILKVGIVQLWHRLFWTAIQPDFFFSWERMDHSCYCRT